MKSSSSTCNGEDSNSSIGYIDDSSWLLNASLDSSMLLTTSMGGTFYYQTTTTTPSLITSRSSIVVDASFADYDTRVGDFNLQASYNNNNNNNTMLYNSSFTTTLAVGQQQRGPCVDQAHQDSSTTLDLDFVPNNACSCDSASSFDLAAFLKDDLLSGGIGLSPLPSKKQVRFGTLTVREFSSSLNNNNNDAVAFGEPIDDDSSLCSFGRAWMLDQNLTRGNKADVVSWILPDDQYQIADYNNNNNNNHNSFPVRMDRRFNHRRALVRRDNLMTATMATTTPFLRCCLNDKPPSSPQRSMNLQTIEERK